MFNINKYKDILKQLFNIKRLLRRGKYILNPLLNIVI